ncbi:MAG: dihydrofolate reductase family protein [Bacteroidota bacterium]
MRKIIYHVATTLDGFIADERGGIGAFLAEGDHVPAYMEHLQTYDTVIMGRKTYEFGYAYGLEAGQPAYPQMQHYIFSRSLHFDEPHEQVHIVSDQWEEKLTELKNEAGSPIYLCGGGAFAEYVLQQGLIDEVWLKLNPAVIGKGIHLFGNFAGQLDLSLLDTTVYESGVLLLKYGLGK